MGPGLIVLGILVSEGLLSAGVPLTVPFPVAIAFLVALFAGFVPGLVSAFLVVAYAAFFGLRTHTFDAGRVAVGLLLAPGIVTGIEIFRRRAEAGKAALEERLRSELAETVERYAAVVQATERAGVGLALLQDRDAREGVYVHVNDAFCSMLGFTRDEVVGMSFAELVHPGHLDEVRVLYERRRRGEAVPHTYETYLTAKDGAAVAVEVSAATSAYEGGFATIAFVKDIRERKRAEEALRETNERLSAILDATPLPTAVFDTSGRVLIWNEAAERVFGWKASEVLGGPNPAIPEDGRAAADELRGRAVAGEVVRDVEVKRRRKDGALIDALVSTAPIRDADGRVTKIIGILADITERTRAEDVLRRREAQLARAETIAHVGSWEWDVAGGAVVWTDEMYRIYGFGQERFPVTFEKAMERVVPEDAARIRTDLERAFRDAKAGETPIQATEYRIRLPDGAVRHLRGEGRLFVDAGGRPHRMIGIVQDVTEAKRTEQALAESEERYRSLVELSPEPVLVYDRGGRIRYVNTAAVRLMGARRRDEVVGRGFSELVEEEGARATVQELVNEAATSDKPRGPVEIAFRLPSGRVLHVEFSSSAITYMGEPARQVVLHDVSGRRQAEDYLRFLSEASRVLSASLDYHETLRRVAELAVPHVADWCVVDVVEPDGTLRRVAIAHRDPAKVALVEELRERYPIPEDAPFGPPHVLQKGESQLFADIDDAVLASFTEDKEHLRLAKEIGFRSAMCVPMVAHDRTLGAITLVSADSGRLYREADLEVAEGLAQRAAMAVENARLYREAQDTEDQIKQYAVDLETMVRERTSDLVAANARLGEAKRNLETIYASTIDAFLFVDEKMRLRSANARFSEFFGFSLEEALGGDSARVRQAARERYARPEQFDVGLAVYKDIGRVLDHEVEIIAPTPRILHEHSQPIVDEEGKYQGRVWTWHDITERKAQETRLRESEERFRQLAETIREVFWMATPDLERTLYVSPAYDDVWGRSRETLFKDPETWQRALHPDDRGRMTGMVERYLRGDADFDIEYRIQRPDGDIRWIHDRAFPIKDAGGAVVRVVGIAEDVTESKHLQEEILRYTHHLEEEVERRTQNLIQSEKLAALGHLVAGVAHEVNNPLAFIKSNTELVLELLHDFPDRKPTRDLRGLLKKNLDGLDRIAAIVQNLKILAGPQRAGREKGDLVSAIRETVGIFRPQFRDRIEVIEEHAPVPKLRFNAGQVNQVLMNLLVNAAEAMLAGGRIWVRTRPDGRFAVLEVEDTGPGIPSEARDKIFNPFFTTKTKGSTGLGLSISYSIVKEHGGDITVSSEPGKGARFTIRLPLEDVA